VEYSNVTHGLMPPGFLALDLSKALQLSVYDPDDNNAKLGAAAFPKRGNGILAHDPSDPVVVVAANGGSDLIYLPKPDRALAGQVINAVLAQDYTSGVFVDDALGAFAGTLPMSAINLGGAAVTPKPSVVVGFRSTSTGCPQPLLCGVEVADSTLQQGQGMHGSFSRADTMNFMAAAGPDFKTRFRDPAPSSNADVGQTIAHLLGLTLPKKGSLTGRVLTEALINGRSAGFTRGMLRSQTSSGGKRTELRYQRVGSVRYFDAAGFRGLTLGLESDHPAQAQPARRRAGTP
jgi:hypothetical protein